MPADVEIAYRETQLAGYRDTLERLKTHSDQSRATSIKRVEKALAREEARLEVLRDKPVDDGVTFDQLGVDYLCIDEAHRYKNLRIVTANRELADAGAKKATDLHLKLSWLRERRGDGRVVTFATGTPVANRVAELYVMQTYLQPDTLADLGLADFDLWAAQFGDIVTRPELDPAGAGWRLTSRFARYRNVPELMRIFGQVADIRLAGDLDLPAPDVAGGQPETVVVPATEELDGYVADLVRRADRIRARAVTPDEDNMLAVTGDGRRAALHLGLVGRRQPEPSKITAAADRITELWAANRDRVYIDPATGDPHPRPGACQIVFCDLGTPGGAAGVCVYDHLRDALVARGVPADKVAYIHDATDDAAKAELFARCRDGRVAVIIGSTEKMGVGTNVQTRLIALHHLDPAWRPADIDQREGRILRQGNQNPQVHIYRYATERSFDVYMWQTLERKAGFIAQVLAGRSGARDLDEIGDPELTFAQVKALATGNPDIVEKAAIDAEIAALERSQRAHRAEQHRLRDHLAAVERDLTATAARITALGDAITGHRPAAGQHLGDRAIPGGDFDAALKATLATLRPDAAARRIGAIDGLPLTARRHGNGDVALTLADPSAGLTVRLTADDIASPRSRPLTRLRNTIADLDERLADATRRHEDLTVERDRTRGCVGIPWPRPDELAAARRRQAELQAAIDADLQNTAGPQPPGVEL